MKGSYKTITVAFLLLMTAFVAFGFTVCDDTDGVTETAFEENGLNYRIKVDGTGTVSLTGYTEEPSSLKINTVKHNGIEYKISTVEAYAFKDCKNLNSIEITSNVQGIGAGAFSGCTGLVMVSIAPTVTDISTDAFSGCKFFETGGEEEIEKVSDIVGFKFEGVFDQGLGYVKLVKVAGLICVNYDLDGGTGSIDDMWIPQGQFFRVADYDGSKVGYIYEGWTDGKSTYKKGMTYPTGSTNVALTAVWSPVPTYKVTFDINGAVPPESVPKSFEAHEGYVFILPACSATKAGYEFGGWNDGKKTCNTGESYMMGGADVSFKAVWNAIPFRAVTYDINGGSGKAPTQEKVMEGSMITVAKYDGNKEGYSFGGWNDGTNIYSPGDLYTVKGNSVKFVAVWNLIPTHVVKYDVDGGSEIKNAQIVQEWTTFYLAGYEGVKEGYQFQGWSDGKNTYQPGDKYEMEDKDLTFKAVWKSTTPEKIPNLGYIIVITVIIIILLFIVIRVIPRRR